MTVPQALFVLDPDDPDVATPTGYARGPWDPGALHGGPVGALVVRAAERCVAATGGQLRVARVSVALERPVPLAALRVRAEVGRPGRKVAWVDVTLTRAGDDTRVARGRCLFVRRADTGLGTGEDPLLGAVPVPVPGPDGLPATRSKWPSAELAFHQDGAEIRFAAGSWADPGPVTVWVRLTVPVVAGEEPTGPQRAVAVADFANGVSAALPKDRWRFLNPDLDVVLADDPIGEWILLDAVTRFGPSGGGYSDSRLGDRTRLLGRATQALLVEEAG